jgi:glycosyltransferase involved in cell wall biosynthesis
MDGKRKVLLVVHSLQGGGAERVIVQLANHLDRARFQAVLALGEIEGPYLKELKSDVAIHHLGAQRARTAIFSIMRAVWSLRPQVILSTAGLNFAVALASPLFPRGTRVILREANSVSAFLNEVAQQSRFRATFYRFVYRRLYQLVDVIICQSDFMLRDIAAMAGLLSNKLVRIHNPVDVEAIALLADQGDAGYLGNGPHLVTMGRCAYQKGYDLLLSAFALVRGTHPEASLTVLGEGEEKATLERLAVQLGLGTSVRFLGFQANPYPYLKGADVFVSSSRYEGSANAILEAMACGTPVVATDCPSSNREVVEEGVTGWLAKVGDVQSLAETISKAISKRSELDSARVRARCESLCSVHTITKLYEAQL